MTPSEKRDALKALGADALVDLLLEQSIRDPDLENKLELLTASDAERGKKVRSKISGLMRIRRFHNWREATKLARKMEDILVVLEGLSLPPKDRLQLLFKFFETDKVVLEHCDDSGGIIGPIYRYTATEVFRRVGACCEEKEWMVDRLMEIMDGNLYGTRDELVAAACTILPEAILREMIDSRLALAAKSESKVVNAWMPVKLARGIPDPILHEKLVLADWKQKPPHAGIWNKIAEVYLEADDAATALQRLSQDSDASPSSQFDRNELMLRAHRMLGQSDQVVAILRAAFLKYPTSKSFQELMEALTDSSVEEPSIIESLDARYLSESKLSVYYLEFMVNYNPSAAEGYLLPRVNQLNGEMYSSLAKIADTFMASNHPLSATLLFRAMVDSTLERAIAKYYKYAVRHLKKCDRLAPLVTDWHGFADHDTYCGELKTRHALKSSLWKLWAPPDKT